MRSAIVVTLLAITVSTAGAQEQEQKLLDRLLKPNTSLEYSGQDKQFTAARAVPEKKAHTKSFHTQDRQLAKEFSGTRSFFARVFGTKKSRYQDAAAHVTPRNTIPNAQVAYATSPYAGARQARDDGRDYATRDYAGTRPFLVQGKSQKALSQQRKQLTIDEVRELLNKNK